MNYISKNNIPLEVGTLIEFYIKSAWHEEHGEEGDKYCERVETLNEDGTITTDNNQHSRWHEENLKLNPSNVIVIPEFKMKPEYRTSTVKAMSQTMLESDNYEALPILADMLEDAGCHDDLILKDLRKVNGHWIEKRRIVNLIYSEETANAVRSIEDLARKYNFCDFDHAYGSSAGHYDRKTGKWVEDPDAGPNPKAFSEIISEAMGSDGYLVAHGTDLHGPPEEVHEFWKNMETFTGKKLSRSMEWSCSC